MKKALIVIITVLCFTVLFGSCKNQENKQPPANKNGAGQNPQNGNGSPGSNPKNPTKPGDKIQTGQPAADGTVPKADGSNPEVVDPTSRGQEPELPVNDGNIYYTIVNNSDNSAIKVSFLDSRSRDPVSKLLERYDCVQITEAQFRNNIVSITHVLDEDEEELFCGGECSPGCDQDCPADNYRMLDGWSYDEIELNQPFSLRQSCVPLLAFE